MSREPEEIGDRDHHDPVIVGMEELEIPEAPENLEIYVSGGREIRTRRCPPPLPAILTICMNYPPPPNFDSKISQLKPPLPPQKNPSPSDCDDTMQWVCVMLDRTETTVNKKHNFGTKLIVGSDTPQTTLHTQYQLIKFSTYAPPRQPTT